MRSPRAALSLLLLPAISGCVSMAPRYRRPDPPVPGAWPGRPASAAEAPEPLAGRIAWRAFYLDERMGKVLDLALRNNRDLRIAVLNTEKARAYYRIQRAGLLPEVNAAAQGFKERLPASVSSTGRSMVVEQDSATVGVSAWELDLFGRVRSLKNQALEQYLATEQARDSAQIALLGGVANLYLALAADREGLKLAQDTLASQDASSRLIQQRFELGLSSEIDAQRARIGLETARGDVARYTRAVALDANALDLLVGTPVPADLLPASLGAVTPLKDPAPGLPSEVLAQRPDIRAAEHQLRAANANLGAARAAFFPRISLTADTGSMAADLSGLFKGGSDTWTFAPQIVLPIFDTGARRANLKVARADRDLALAQYEKAIQSAFREVADALAQRATLGDQLAAQEALVGALDRTWQLATERYKAGLDGSLGVLDAQRSLFAAQQALLALRLARAANLVTLYQVLGGGLVDGAAPPPGRTPSAAR